MIFDSPKVGQAQICQLELSIVWVLRLAVSDENVHWLDVLMPSTTFASARPKMPQSRGALTLSKLAVRLDQETQRECFLLLL